jgi:hypothetical protein
MQFFCFFSCFSDTHQNNVESFVDSQGRLPIHGDDTTPICDIEGRVIKGSTPMIGGQKDEIKAKQDRHSNAQQRKQTNACVHIDMHGSHADLATEPPR